MNNNPMFARSEAIKAEYLASECQTSDVDEAVNKLMTECSELFHDHVGFKDANAAWNFLMEEIHKENKEDDDQPDAYYVWHGEGRCDNKTNDLDDARRIEKEFLDSHVEAYITDVDGNVIDEAFVENNRPSSPRP